MTISKKAKSIKILALMVSFLMVVQSIVWADPNIMRLDNIQVESDFSFLEGKANIGAGYLAKVLGQIEATPHNRDIISVGKHAEEVIRQIMASKPEIGQFFEVINTPEKGEVLVKVNHTKGSDDKDLVTIRYFNPRVTSPVRDNSDIVIGRYLHKEVVVGKIKNVEEQLKEDRASAAEYKRVLKALKDILPGSIILHTFSSLSVDTSFEGDDANRIVIQDFLKKNGIYVEQPEGRIADAEKLGYEWAVLPIIMPKGEIPADLLENIGNETGEKKTGAIVGAFLKDRLGKLGINIQEEQVRSHLLDPKKIGYMAFDAASAIAVVTEKGDILVKTHFWMKRNFKAMESLNKKINDEMLLQDITVEKDLSEIEVKDSKDALNVLGKYSWFFLKEFQEGDYSNAGLLTDIIGKIDPKDLIDFEDIRWDKKWNLFVSDRDANGFGAHLESFQTQLNSMQQLSMLLYLLLTPKYDGSIAKGVSIGDKKLENSIVRLYYKISKHLRETAERRFGDIAALMPLQIEVGYYFNRVNKAIRNENALELNEAEFKNVEKHIGENLSSGEKMDLLKMYSNYGKEAWAYDLLQLSEILSEDHFAVVSKKLKVDAPRTITPSEKSNEVFDATGRIATLGLALRVSSDLNLLDKDPAYKGKYMIRTSKIITQEGYDKLDAARTVLEKMFSDVVIKNSGLMIKTKDGELTSIGSLIAEGKLVFAKGDKVLEAKQDFQVDVPVKSVYTVNLLLEGKDVGTFYVLDAKEFTEKIKALNIEQDNIPRPCIVKDGDEDIFFGLMTDATPGGVWIGDGVVEQLLTPNDYEKITAWQMAGTKISPESGLGTLKSFVSILIDIAEGGQISLDDKGKIETAIRAINTQIGNNEEVKNILPDAITAMNMVRKIENRTITDKEIKTRLLGGPEEELLRLEELLSNIEETRMVNGDAFIYLKAQIAQKLLLPLGGGIHFLGRYLHKLPAAFETGAHYLTPTSCSTNGGSHISLMLSVMFGGYGTGKLLSVLATTLHMYTSDGKKGPFGHVFPKSTGAAEGVKQHFRIRAMFTALRTPVGLIDGNVNVVGGSAFDFLADFPNGVQEKVLKKYIERIGDEFPQILKVFGPETDRDEEDRYRWEDTISGQKTGSIIYLDHIRQITENIVRMTVPYDNEMSYSFKMHWLLLNMFNSIKRQRDIRERAKLLAPDPDEGEGMLLAADKGMQVRAIDELPEGIESAIIGVDWNTPIKGGKVSNDSRIRGSIPTLKDVVKKTGVKNLFAISHLGRPKGEGFEEDFSMAPVVERAKEIFKEEGIDTDIVLLPYYHSSAKDTMEEARRKDPDRTILFVFENIRFYSAERSKDVEERLEFEKWLKDVTRADAYVGEAFDKAHRGEEASMELVNLFAPKNRAAGVSLEKEIEKIIKFEESVTGKIVAVFGGAKFEKFTTIGLLAEKIAASNGTIVITGALASAYLQLEKLKDMGKSKLPEDGKNLALVKAGIEAIKKSGVQVVLPVDFFWEQETQIDTGKVTNEKIAELISSLEPGDGLIVNGGTGIFEKEEGAAGTVSLVSAASEAADKGVSVFAAGADMNNAIDITEEKTGVKVSDKIIRSTGGGALLTALARGVMELSPIAALIKTREDGKGTLLDRGENLTPTVIQDNAKNVINSLVNALTLVSKKNEKVVLALDTELGKGEINRLLQDLTRFIPELSKNNEDLARLLRNLIVIRGEGKELSDRLEGDLKSVKKENFIIIASEDNVSKHFNKLKGVSVIAGIDDSQLSENDYIPLLEIMYFSAGKYFGWSTENLRKIYAMIPNVKTPDSGNDEYKMLFDENSREFLFRIVPDAARFDTEELRELIKQLRTILTRA
ncbi:MAG: phosphoglycerate kinase [Candidatus Omnitrophota bacterium]